MVGVVSHAQRLTFIAVWAVFRSFFKKRASKNEGKNTAAASFLCCRCFVRPPQRVFVFGTYDDVLVNGMKYARDLAPHRKLVLLVQCSLEMLLTDGLWQSAIKCQSNNPPPPLPNGERIEKVVVRLGGKFKDNQMARNLVGGNCLSISLCLGLASCRARMMVLCWHSIGWGILEVSDGGEKWNCPCVRDFGAR